MEELLAELAHIVEWMCDAAACAGMDQGPPPEEAPNPYGCTLDLELK